MARSVSFNDRFHAAPQFLAIPKRHRNAAYGLFSRAFAYTGKREEDGYIFHADAARILGGTPAVVDALVRAGLWTPLPPGDRFRIEGEGELWEREFSA